MDEEILPQTKKTEEESKETDDRVAGKTNAELATEIEEFESEC